MRLLKTLFFLFSFLSIIYSQPTGNVYSDSYGLINNRNVGFPFTITQISIPNSNDALPYYYYVTFDSSIVIHASGIAVSGYGNGELWANGIMNSKQINDYTAGCVGDDGGKIYYVKNDDPPFGESWQEWSEAVNKGARFYDGDGDGVYNPVDKNGNGVWDYNEDKPEINGTVTAFSVFNDDVPSADRKFTNMEPQGIEIRRTIWTNNGNPNLSNVFFIRYSIYNSGTVAETLDSVYFGIWNDSDIGNYTDDLLGSSKDLFTGYTYNYGNDNSFGNNPPAAFTTLVGITENEDYNLIDLSSLETGYMQTSFAPGDNIPTDATQLRNLLTGKLPDGTLIDPCNWSEGIVVNQDCSSIDASWSYSGNPADSIGWLNNTPMDETSLMSFGPFTIAAGEKVDITVAYHFEQGESALGSVTEGLATAEYIRNNDNVLSAGNGTSTIPVKFVLEQNYPNPFSAKGVSTTTIKYSIPSVIARRSGATTRQSQELTVQLTVYDVLGRKVATLVNAKQAPGNYSVKFNANKLSSGIYFYRLSAGNFAATKKMILMK